MSRADKVMLGAFILVGAVLADKVAAKISFALHACGAC